MTESDLPAPIRAFIDATNDADTDAFVAAFTPDAHLDDYGRGFDGHDGAREWNRTDNIGVNAHFTDVTARAGDSDDEYVVTLTVSSHRANGTGTIRFTLQNGLIARMIIP